MNNSPIQFATLNREHPQLTDKALIDFSNGLEVIGDHIRVRERNNSSFWARLLSQANGKSALRQQAIDQNITESLKTVSTWLQYLQNQQIQSDLAIAKVANKLSETRQGVMLLSNKHNALQQEVAQLLLAMDGMDTKYTQLSARLEQVDCGRLASQQIDAVFDKWQAGRLNHYPVLIRLFLVFDELYWGDFGNYCRQSGLQHREIQRLNQQVRDKALIQLKYDWVNSQLPSIAYAWQTDTHFHLQSLATEHREMIAYLTDTAAHKTMPILWIINQLASNTTNTKLLPNINVPIILTAQNTINRFSFDFEARYKHE
jgi:hypothetical protein